MVLGLRSKNRKGTSVHVDFTIHVQEIKPWPPSQSLRSVRSVVLQWENGDQNSGSGRPVVPSLDDGRIVLDESFKLQATLLKEAAGKGNDGGAFQRNILELNLYEPRRDKGARGQLLGSAAVDLAEHGVIREAVSLGVPVSCKRSFRNTAQPVLFLKIQTLKKAEEGSSSSESLLKEEGSAGRDAGGSVSPLMHGECPEEEIASFTDDDISSSHSSLPYSAPPKDPDERSQNQDARASPSPSGTNSSRENSTMIQEELDASPPSTVSEPTEPETSKMENDEGEEEAPESRVDAKAEQRETEHHDNGDLTVEGTLNKVECSENAGNDCGRIENGGMICNGAEESFLEREGEVIAPENSGIISNGEGESLPEKEGEETPPENGGQTVDEALNDSVEIRCLTEDSDGQSIVGQLSGTPQKSPEEDQGTCDLQCGKNFAVADGGDPAGKPRSLKSVRSPSLTARNDNSAEDVKEIDVLGNAHHGSKKFRNGGSSFSSKRVNELESRVRMLEAELREAAAVEIGLYSVVAEHGSSAQKVHTPARRLLRLYTRACREESQERRGGAARSAVSGLVLVAKACGNDVPRLTFWLSNAAVLRATVSQGVDPSDPAMSNLRDRNPGPLRWESTAKSQKQLSFMEDLDDWEDPNIFISALEKIEAWIFSRVVESLWWQTLTPHMQSADEIDRSKGSSSARNGHGKQSSAKDQNQASFSMELWKRAFKDACERLCPVRAGGHQCGCLPMLPRLIMEQCVARLDVAMFNALLRESGDDIPTDPVSDPITDARVLPIAAGKSSFGAGAQLKNAIGNWSRGLTDWFGIDDDDEDDNSSEGEGEDDHRREAAAPQKSFRLLNALSDLLMLPKDMLLDESIRREVCPSFGEPVLRRILCGFEPDEFCPDPVPEELLDALDSQEVVADGDEVVGSFPCGAAPVVYSPPPAKAVAEAIGDPRGRPFLSRIGSAVLRKSHTSDDELEELDAPLTLIAADRSRLLTPSPNGGARLTRYHLLREVWRGDD